MNKSNTITPTTTTTTPSLISTPTSTPPVTPPVTPPQSPRNKLSTTTTTTLTSPSTAITARSLHHLPKEIFLSILEYILPINTFKNTESTTLISETNSGINEHNHTQCICQQIQLPYITIFSISIKNYFETLFSQLFPDFSSLRILNKTCKNFIETFIQSWLPAEIKLDDNFLYSLCSLLEKNNKAFDQIKNFINKYQLKYYINITLKSIEDLKKLTNAITTLSEKEILKHIHLDKLTFPVCENPEHAQLFQKLLNSINESELNLKFVHINSLHETLTFSENSSSKILLPACDHLFLYYNKKVINLTIPSDIILEKLVNFTKQNPNPFQGWQSSITLPDITADNILLINELIKSTAPYISYLHFGIIKQDLQLSHTFTNLIEFRCFYIKESCTVNFSGDFPKLNKIEISRYTGGKLKVEGNCPELSCFKFHSFDNKECVDFKKDAYPKLSEFICRPIRSIPSFIPILPSVTSLTCDQIHSIATIQNDCANLVSFKTGGISSNSTIDGKLFPKLGSFVCKMGLDASSLSFSGKFFNFKKFKALQLINNQNILFDGTFALNSIILESASNISISIDANCPELNPKLYTQNSENEKQPSDGELYPVKITLKGEYPNLTEIKCEAMPHSNPKIQIIKK